MLSNNALSQNANSDPLYRTVLMKEKEVCLSIVPHVKRMMPDRRNWCGLFMGEEIAARKGFIRWVDWYLTYCYYFIVSLTLEFAEIS